MAIRRENLPDLTIGDDIEFDIIVQDKWGQPQSIVGDTFWYTVKENYEQEDGDAIIQVSSTIADTETAQQGMGTLTVTGADNTISAGDYIYDIQWRTVGGITTTYSIGSVSYKKEVTKS